MRKICLFFIAVLSVLLMTGSAMAATSVSWTSPAEGTSYTLPANVQPEGIASCTGVSGGLDLALVLDSSGSMTYPETVGGEMKSRQAWQKQFAKELVASLPAATTSVAVIEFDSNANTVQQLLALTPSANLTTINSAIDSVDASGGTTIGNGINEAKNELTSARADIVNRSQMMVVFSDGSSSGSPGETADNAIAAGIEAIHSVGLPGHYQPTMKKIVDGVDDIYNTSDDHGIYTDGSNLQTLVDIFGGTGNLVGIDYVTISLPDGTLLNSANGDFSVGALGNFKVPAPYWDMEPGQNTFTATAYCDDGGSASAALNLYGGQQPVPEPATVMLMGIGLLGLVPFARKKLKK
ncbi:MAG: VWA domain-containing protein [Desulfosalsimonadaceae bacterium]